MSKKMIPFSPPDIGPAEIKAVSDVLRSGWITTGSRVSLFEKELARYNQADRAVCLNSATAGLELLLRIMDIGPGDEVITTPYTYAATANVILHTGATPVFADIKKDSFHIDPAKINQKLNSKTKAVITVDYGGWPCDYSEIFEAVHNKKKLYRPKAGSLSESFPRVPVISDCAHGLGATYHGKAMGTVADFNVFSFHAVKNLTTAEGGAILWKDHEFLNNETVYSLLKVLSLHGQNKDAYRKLQINNWKYDIISPGYKYNMTDINAAIGLAQLERYDESILSRRAEIFNEYNSAFSKLPGLLIPPFESEQASNSYHLYPLRLSGGDESKRNTFIQDLGAKGISANVHYIPLPMMTAYRKLGYKIDDYPNAYESYQKEISLPLYSRLSPEDQARIIYSVLETLGEE